MIVRMPDVIQAALTRYSRLSHISESFCHAKQASPAMSMPPLVAMPARASTAGEVRYASDETDAVAPTRNHSQRVLQAHDERERQGQLLVLGEELRRLDAALAPRGRRHAQVLIIIVVGADQRDGRHAHVAARAGLVVVRHRLIDRFCTGFVFSRSSIIRLTLYSLHTTRVAAK